MLGGQTEVERPSVDVADLVALPNETTEGRQLGLVLRSGEPQ